MRKQKHASRHCSRLMHVAAGSAGTYERRARELRLLEGASTREIRERKHIRCLRRRACLGTQQAHRRLDTARPCSFTSQPKAKAQVQARAELASCRCAHRPARPKHAPGALPLQTCSLTSQLEAQACVRAEHASCRWSDRRACRRHAAGTALPQGCSCTSRPKAQARAKAEHASCRCSSRRACPRCSAGAYRRLRAAHAGRSRKCKHVREQCTRAAAARRRKRVRDQSTPAQDARVVERALAHSRCMAASTLLAHVVAKGANVCTSGAADARIFERASGTRQKQHRRLKATCSHRRRKRKHVQEQSTRAAVGRFVELAVGTQQAHRYQKAAHARRNR